MNLNKEYYDEEKKKIIKRDKRKYNKEYYLNVRKHIQNIEKCRTYASEYRTDENIKIQIEEGKFLIEV